jgi:hypothetical protein
MDYSALKGIPIDHLVSAPLIASARGNGALSEVNLEVFLKLAFLDGTGKKPAPRMLTFDLERPYQTNKADGTAGAWTKQALQVNVPCAALLPLPALMVDKISIDFTTSMSNETVDKVEVGVEVGAEGGFGAFSFTAKVTTNVENQRTSKQECTYQFHVEASQQPQAEGMSKLCDIFASVIEPMPTGGGGCSTPPATPPKKGP